MKHRQWIVGALFAVLLALPAITTAAVTAYFDDASSSDVDGYAGTGGNGWVGQWYHKETTDSESTRTWMQPDALPPPLDYVSFHAGNDSYLRIQMENTSDPLNTSKGKGSVFRQYTDTDTGGIDVSQSYTIAFKVRPEAMDTFSTSQDCYKIYGHGQSNLNNIYNNDGSNTFLIQGAGGTGSTHNNWVFRNQKTDYMGVQSTVSNVFLMEDHIYDFSITMHPDDGDADTYGTWDCTVTDTMFSLAEVQAAYPGEDTSGAQATATVMGMLWTYGTEGTYHGGMTAAGEDLGYLVFALQEGGDNDLGEMQTMSIDDIVITQLAPPPIPGDTEPDGDVDAADAAVLASHWGAPATPGDYTVGNFNDDTVVDAADAAILAANWTGAGEAANVPEPSTLVLVLLGVLTLAIGRRRPASTGERS